MKTLIILLLTGLGFLPCFAELTFTHTFKDQAGQPLSQILIRATPQGDNPGSAVEQRTLSSGVITMTLADAEWFVEVDPRELLERGYFCIPGSCLSPVCRPVFIDAVTLTPTISVNRSLTGTISVVATFDWLENLDPFLYRQCRIERSTDMKIWQPLSSILLTNPPIRLTDPDAEGQPCVFYRIMPEPDFQVREFTWITLPLGPEL